MRLLKFDDHGELSLTKDLIDNIPRYAILSHTWGADDEEVTFNDLKYGSSQRKAGYEKIHFCGEQAQKDGLQYFWVDTCCIDKANHAELAEAIVSMYRWYRDAEKCYVYLADVSVEVVDKNSQPQRTWEADFRRSRWFTRGWTLQELLAPKTVEFFSRERKWLGDKHTLERLIHETTEIPLTALRGVPLLTFSVEERMRWAAKRDTKRKEDKAYCLLGIFNVFMPPIYGEGDHAFIRLQSEIDKLSGAQVDSNKVSDVRHARPIWYIPFSQTSEFVGRTCQLRRLKRKIEELGSSQIVSILGLGGVGKSRLALELVYQIRSEHPQYSHFWIEATDRLTFERDLLEIGKKLGIPGIEDAKADVKTLVKQWLNHPEERWLLILDNADDEALWGRRSDPTDGKSTAAEWLPTLTNGTIIITTRSRRVASHLAGKEVIELTAMSPEEARTMFKNALEKPEIAADENETTILLDKLTYLPLAIFQAASYMNMTQEPLATYLELMDKPEEEVVELLSEDFGDRSRYSSAHNPVATTWLISFNRIREYHPLAAQFLSSMACLREKSIPESLLPEVDSRKDAIGALATLKGYSFVTRQTGNDGRINHEALYDMHRLVYLAARSWLRKQGKLRDWQKACIIRLAELFPQRDYQYKNVWTAYLPHAQRLCEESETEDFPKRYRLLEKMGLCLIADGKFGEAVDAHRAVVHWREKKLGISDEETLRAYNNLGEALNWKGDHHVAEKYLQKALQLQEILGPEHPDTLTNIDNLASTYWNQGRWKEAEELEVQVMETSTRVLGAEHPDTLTSIGNLASMYRDQGRWKEAEELEVQVMETRTRVLGAEHPNTLTSIANLASTYWGQGRWKEAEELEVQVMKTRTRVLGAEHPYTLTSIANLASTYRDQGRWREAEELEVQVMETRTRVLGAEHPDTLISIGNLALTYQYQGRWKEAEELGMQVMETRTRVLGAEHPHTLNSMANLAHTLKNQNRGDEATWLMASCVEIRQRVLGASHPHTQSAEQTLRAWLSADDDTDSTDPEAQSVDDPWMMPGAWVE
ncbi:hypothetical protein AYL99_02286 [Fonsecaea erecta]|uniref:Uncharacterized protein n=1 Tax=Fonsecaea erecta TaxID=1367422 RepID=A0A178ZTF1_9EURO|nr:hypothetical protein AYL99_02286 [Fonsecaea erecta]OAP63059.1 hypothetical protein AYL99_02286 [Fonsecaea erecta]